MSENVFVLIGGADGKPIRLDASMANRHGLVAGATGTGKTVTLQVLAEGFSRLGVPVFSADVKGDLSGIAAPGKAHPKVDERIEKIGITDWKAQANPVCFWDIKGETGHPVRTTVADMGAELIANLLQLNETQTGLLHIAFDYAETEELPLLDLADLKAVLQWMQERRKTLAADYGSLSSRSLGAILRRLLVLKKQGGDSFFGEPALDIQDLIRVQDGRGVINLLDGRKLMLEPRIYTTFLLWLMTELFEQLPECGDATKPRLVFFFDEAHLLFDHAPKALQDRIEQTVRLIRSKGVGIYFVSQSPADIPADVLGQLGNRVQHALRAFTPKDQKAVRVAAQTFRANPNLDTESIIGSLGLGEALVSTLDGSGVPQMVEKTLIAPPRSQIGPISEAEQNQFRQTSTLSARYDMPLDRDSAMERLQRRRLEKQPIDDGPVRKKSPRSRKTSRRQGLGETFLKSLLRGLASQLSRALVRLLRR